MHFSFKFYLKVLAFILFARPLFAEDLSSLSKSIDQIFIESRAKNLKWYQDELNSLETSHREALKKFALIKTVIVQKLEKIHRVSSRHTKDEKIQAEELINELRAAENEFNAENGKYILTKENFTESIRFILGEIKNDEKSSPTAEGSESNSPAKQAQPTNENIIQPDNKAPIPLILDKSSK
ncbi:MAG: hypothetical protein JWQ35_1356 [Bacteriovoracaceae bacterium]|nr:hypothetical protein [Bacteriovoracaceae bacterium]